MTQQPSQNPKVTECSICRRNGINGVKIFLHKVGNNWIPTDANPETNQDLDVTHYHMKFCRNNCGVVGYYNPEEKTFIERSTGQRHECPNFGQQQPEQPQPQEQQQPQPQEQPMVKNPIAEVAAKVAPVISTDEATRRIALIWTLLQEDHKKIDELYKSSKSTQELLNKFMDSYQKLEASIKTVLENPDNIFKKSSEYPKTDADSVTHTYPDQDSNYGE